MGLSCTLAWTGCDPRRPLCARFSAVNVSRDAAGPDVEPTDRRRLDLIVYGTTTPAGLALCCDATLMSPLTLDRALLAQLCAPGLGRKTQRAHLALLQQPHAGAWLHAAPSRVQCLHVDGALFETMVRLRLRLAVADSDGRCLLFRPGAMSCGQCSGGPQKPRDWASTWQILEDAAFFFLRA